MTNAFPGFFQLYLVKTDTEFNAEREIRMEPERDLGDICERHIPSLSQHIFLEHPLCGAADRSILPSFDC